MPEFRPLRSVDVIVTRTDDPPAVHANVPHIVDRSPTGFEYGFAGAGPHDLALSILNAFVPPFYCGERAPKIFDNGYMCSGFALRWAGDFSRAFTDTLPREAGEYRLSASRINEWIAAKLTEQEKAADSFTQTLREQGLLRP